MIRFFENVGQIARLIMEAFYHIVRGDVEFKNTTQQMVALGVRSIPLVLIINGFTGMVFSLQVAQEMKRFGAESFIGQLLGLAVIRELGAVLTGVVVAGRAGSAIAAELGAMNVTEQIDALKAMATSPVQYLVVPRVIACMIMVPALTVFAHLIGMTGGYVVATNQVGIIPMVFYQSSIRAINIYDILCSLVKAAVFGIIVAIAGCYHGLNTTKGAQGVGTATIAAVVSSMIGIFISNYFLSALMW
ncbi:MAG: ABC transporter permease [Firmicutes bacterium]|jgi:phospholipid/cholesterol/gamma-HCH transport system permease protein|nr:ABC transporter permease [Bacillota bacterium]NLL89088.1 ABC transporter permease [Bacillota bacterium]HKM16835.1 ABC transporter permease [Limnochordia bacterium]